MTDQTPAAAPARAPAIPTVYDVSLGVAGVNAVRLWAEENVPNWENDPNADPFPIDMSIGDSAYLGMQDGHTRDVAVGRLLDALAMRAARNPDAPEDLLDRLELVRLADEQGIRIEYVLVPRSSVGFVTLETEVTKTRKPVKS